MCYVLEKLINLSDVYKWIYKRYWSPYYNGRDDVECPEYI